MKEQILLMEDKMNKEYNDEYEKVCYLCKRSESKAGKMMMMPGNICVCSDCMQKTFDTVSNTDFSKLNMGDFPGINVFTQMFADTSKQEEQKLKKGDIDR